MPAIVSPRKTSSDSSRPLIVEASSAGVAAGLVVTLSTELAISLPPVRSCIAGIFPTGNENCTLNAPADPRRKRCGCRAASGSLMVACCPSDRRAALTLTDPPSRADTIEVNLNNGQESANLPPAQSTVLRQGGMRMLRSLNRASYHKSGGRRSNEIYG